MGNAFDKDASPYGTYRGRKGTRRQWHGAFKGVADARKLAQVDPYEVLGVDPETPWPEVVASFRDLAKMAHPDHGGDPELFRSVMAAFDLLKKTRKA